MFRVLLVSSILLLSVAPICVVHAAQYGEIKNAPWELHRGDRFLNQDHLTMGTCEANTEGAIICFEFFWREGHLELYAIMPFPPGRDGKFAEWKVPDFQIDQKYRFSLNRLLDSDRWLGFTGFPQINRGNSIAWRIQVREDNKLRNSPKGMVYNLTHGRLATLTVNVDDGSTIETEFLLEGLAPMLERMLQEAEAAASYYQDQK